MTARGHIPVSADTTSCPSPVDTFTSTQHALDFAASLPRGHAEALLLRACERAGWQGQAPTWDAIKAALRPVSPFRWGGGRLGEAALLVAQRQGGYPAAISLRKAIVTDLKKLGDGDPNEVLRGCLKKA